VTADYRRYRCERFRQLLVALLVISLGLSSTALAQERHAVDPSTLSQAVANHVASQDASPRVDSRDAESP
jgi:hypothetical protein